MSWFPQIGQGSVTQFPFSRSRTWRTIHNELESGEQIVLPDAAGGGVAWSLAYKDLNDDEAGRLQALFAASQGSYGAFAFADPLANLLGWSEDLSRPDWQLGLLTASGGAQDPNGTLRAWSLTNGSPGDQALIQTVALPGEYVTCFSVWIRSDTAFEVTLKRDGLQAAAVCGPLWKRFFISGTGPVGADSAVYSILVPAGGTVQVWGMQVEVQPYPSQYRTAQQSSGIHEETYFGSDDLTMTDTGPGLHSCELKLISRI